MALARYDGAGPGGEKLADRVRFDGEGAVIPPIKGAASLFVDFVGSSIGLLLACALMRVSGRVEDAQIEN